jgi:carboxyl-terminal processing protease
MKTKQALEDLKTKEQRRIVLDLRDNLAVLLNEAEIFVICTKNEVIVTTKSQHEKYNNTYKTQNEPVDTQIPLVIIVNDRSAIRNCVWSFTRSRQGCDRGKPQFW